MLREITIMVFAIAIVIASAFYCGTKLGERLTCNMVRIDPDSVKCSEFIREFKEGIGYAE